MLCNGRVTRKVSGIRRASTNADAGFRVIAHKHANCVKLHSRPRNDLTDRFPLIVEALAKLRSHSCIIDGEAVACGEDGIALFDRIRCRRHDASVFLYAFILVELDGDDLRRDPLVVRKTTLASLLTHVGPGLRFNEHLDEEDGPLVFAHACKLGLEGIVSRRRDSPYRSERTPDWIKSKNPEAPAVRREAEEDWRWCIGMSEYLFGLHCGHLSAATDQIAARHGARHVNTHGAAGERCGWFACPNRESQFAVANAVMSDIDRAGGIETFRPR